MTTFTDFLVKEYIGKDVVITLKGGDSTFHMIGQIDEFVYNEYDGGYLVFRHVDTEAKRLQADTSVFNLHDVVILSIDPLREDFDESAFIVCPECDTHIKLTSLKVRRKAFSTVVD